MTAQLVETTEVTELARQMVDWLATGEVTDGLFAPDVFCDFSVPQWRLQSDTLDGMLALRRTSHPAPGQVVNQRVDPTPTGFVIEFDEHWHDGAGECWYAREMIRVEIQDGQIAAMSVYCTGDWDGARQAAHSAEVTLLRP